MKPVAAYLDRLFEIRASRRGTPELSYRAALENLLNAVGADLDPVVRATAELADTGSGRPDFGLAEAKSGNLRAVVEVKSLTESVPETAGAEQVTRYGKRYGYVLVTNYWDFLLVVCGNDGVAHIEHRYRIAASAEAFWRASPSTLAKEHSDSLEDFLASAMTRAAPIARAADLATDLARHAREARRRLARHDTSALAPLQDAMEQSLGLHFSGDEGIGFFQSSLVQTLFYGLFSGWMLWRQHSGRRGPFEWKSASEYLALPLIGDLYEEIARPKRLADLGLREPLEWATASLNRVIENEFFKRFDAEHAITLFYEPFLAAFDPKLRKELGVWYTPPEIVRYMVGRVDQVLRDELGIADGFADESVYVLDPAAGTGSYLVEVAKRIHRTLSEQGHGALAAARVKHALCSRVYGFEILPAPYIVAHLQLGILLRSLEVPLASRDRCEVYLTNALTGWEPPKEPKSSLLFPELQKESERAGGVKRTKPILVVIGNPPYNRFAGVAEDEEADLIEPYKGGLYEIWGIRKQLLDDLYIRFFRLAEKRLAEVGGRGVVSYISNYSWLDGLSHPVMRERLAANFDAVWIDNCNGDKYKTGKRTPDGRPDESMFTTDDHRVGIQVGTAIATFLKTRPKAAGDDAVDNGPTVYYREFWGTGNVKRAALLASLNKDEPARANYQAFGPRSTMRWVFVPVGDGAASYDTWCPLADLFPTHYSGLNENRQGALFSDEAAVLEARMMRYFDPHISDAAVKEDSPGLMTPAAGFEPVSVRQIMLRGSGLHAENIVRVAYRPFDDIWVYWAREGKLLNRCRPDFFEQVWPGNRFLSASQTGRKGGFNVPTIVDKFGDLHLQDPWSQFLPLWIRTSDPLLGESCEPNIDRAVLESLCTAFQSKAFDAGWHATKTAREVAEDVFYHALAVLWSPKYRTDNAQALKQDWPRIPLPADRATLGESANLGRAVADLLLPDVPVRGVTVGQLRPELRALAVPAKVGGGAIEPESDLKIEAGYGFRGQKNAVMCGKGRIVPSREHSDAFDVYINDRVYWANVPKDVWEMTIGGYPVVKKWLSYREHKILGRPLRLEEVTYITELVRRLKAMLLLGTSLDASYQTIVSQAVPAMRTTNHKPAK